MRIMLAAAAALTLAFATPAIANGNNNGPTCLPGACNETNNVTNNTTNQGGNAGAVGIGKGGAGGNAAASSTNRNTNTNVNANSASSDQRQGQAQGQSQSTTNSNNASQSVNVEGDDYEAPRMVHLAPSVSVAPSANCALAQGGSVGVLDLFSIGGTVTYIDEGCALREAIRLGMADSDPRVRAAASSRLLDLLGANEEPAQTSASEPAVRQVSGSAPDWCSDPEKFARFNGKAFCPNT